MLKSVQVREQHLLQRQRPAGLSWRVALQLHGREPPGLLQREEPEPRQDEGGLEQPGPPTAVGLPVPAACSKS
jgi:hypothetical protein